MADGTVYGMYDGRAAAHPDRPVLYYDGRTITFAEIQRESVHAAAGLKGLGIGPGDRVALWLPNTPAYLALYLACTRLGAIAVAVNTRFRSAEVTDIVRRSGAKVLAYWPGFRGIDFVGILADCDRAALDRLTAVISYTEDGAASSRQHWSPHEKCRTLSYGQLLEGPALEAFDGTADSPCNVFTTSGTTSVPKFVLHKQRGIVEHSADVAVGFGYNLRDGALLQAVPLCGVFGFNQLLAGITAGRSTVMLTNFDAEQVIELAARYRVQDMNGADEMYAAILDATDRERPMPLMRECGYASFNPSLADIVERAEARGLYLCGCYGMSEVQALYSWQDWQSPASERQLGGGVPVAPSARVRVRDPDSGELLEPGSTGLLEVSGPSLMAGYLENDEATSKALAEDGFMKTGDLGRLHDDSRRFDYLARQGDVLRLGGFLVGANEIEAEVQKFSGIKGCQVVAAQVDDRTSAFAFVMMSPGQTLDTNGLYEHCSRRLAKFKVPARIIEVEAFPIVESANGPKISKAKLRELAKSAVSAERSGDAAPTR